MSDTEKNIHAGHRKRMRERFLKNGFDGWSEHEILEFLMFYVHTRKNTNNIGHALIDHFGSLKAVMEAEYYDLLEVPDIGEAGAVFITFLHNLQVYCQQPEESHPNLTEYEDRKKFFQDKLRYEKNEVVLVACLDDSNTIMDCVQVSEGVVGQTQMGIQELLRVLLRSNCSRVMLAHNHPRGLLIPSPEDRYTTLNLVKFLRMSGYELVDHIIVNAKGAISMEECGGFYTVQ